MDLRELERITKMICSNSDNEYNLYLMCCWWKNYIAERLNINDERLDTFFEKLYNLCTEYNIKEISFETLELYAALNDSDLPLYTESSDDVVESDIKTFYDESGFYVTKKENKFKNFFKKLFKK